MSLEYSAKIKKLCMYILYTDILCCTYPSTHSKYQGDLMKLTYLNLIPSEAHGSFISIRNQENKDQISVSIHDQGSRPKI